MSPVEGHVSAVHAAHGQRVAAGAALVSFDTGQLAEARRGAEIAHIKARDRLAALGMSAHVAVTVYERPAALLVPIGAVERAGGEAWLRVLDRRTGDTARRAVALGITTLDSVEVTAGLAAGEEIVLPAGGSGAGGAPFNGAFSR